MRLSTDDIPSFYEDCYTPGPDGEKYRLWRELGARTKADHVEDLAARIEQPRLATVLEVGCGDGAVLAELARRGLGTTHVGLEISRTGAELAAKRPEIAEAAVFDGTHIAASEGAFDLAYATHVFEHVPDPAPLLNEMMRVARAVVIEVPLEDNLSARRPAATAASEAVGHLHRFDRAQMRAMIEAAGWRVRGEILDPLPRDVHLFGATTPRGQVKGYAKWATRAAIAKLPALGPRLITLHYAVAATP